MQDLDLEVKKLIIEVLHLEDIKPDDINTDAPLFVEGLGLDSIDALELGVAIRERFGVQLSSDPEESRKHFASVRALSTLITSQPR